MITENPMKIDYAKAVNRVLIGAGIALLLLAVLLLKVGEIESWVYIPIMTTCIGGACGGLFYYFVRDYFFKDHKYRKLISVFCGICYMIAFWLSLIFALDQVGLWN